MAIVPISAQDVTVAIQAEIATTQAQYKAVLNTAAENLTVAAPADTSSVQVSVASGPLVKLDPDTEMTMRQLETRLDQLKELHEWIKVDPELARFVATAATRTPAATTSAVAPPASGPGDALPATAQSRGGSRGALIALIAFAALVAGWLLSLALPVSLLVH